MRKILFILICLSLSCDDQDGWDCLQTAGQTVEEIYEVGAFDKIRVNRNVELILKQGDTQRVRIETGENLLSDIEVEVIEGQLILSDLNHCNFVRDSGITKAFVTAPNIEEIRCSTQFLISSDGVLSYDKLNLISENYLKPDIYSVGDFNLTIDCNQLNVASNGVSIFNIDGKVNDLYVGFFAGIGRFEGQSLMAENVRVFHEGNNDIVVNPQQKLTGQIRSTGNVISHNQPQTVDVTELYLGKVIFVD